MHTSNNQWWIALAAAVAITSGLSGSVHLMRGSFSLGTGLLALSVVALRWPRAIWSSRDPAPTLSWQQRRMALLVVCAVAVFFRIYRMTPPGLWGDDALNGLLAFDILDGKITSPFEIIHHSYSRFHALSNYPVAGAFRLLGSGPDTLRIPGLVANLLAVPLLYGIIAPLFGARLALLSAFFFASSPLQIGHAKGLVQVGFGECFQMLGLCLLVRGMTGARRWLIVASAVPFALSMYTYHAAKLAPLVAIPYAIAAWRTAPGPRRRLTGIGIATCIVFFLCLVPAVLSYTRMPGALTGRIGGTSLWPQLREGGSLWPLWESLWRTLMIFHYEQGPKYHWFGLGHDPAFNIVTAFLLVHGLVASLQRWREPRHLLLLTWVLIGLIPGVLSTGAPRAYRILLATPPLYVWAALPVILLFHYAPRPGVTQRWLRGLAVLLILAVPVFDFNYYFHRVYTHPTFHWFQGARIVEMARALRGMGSDWTGYLLSDNFEAGHESLRFLARAWGLKARDVASLTDILPLRELPEGGALFLFDRGALGSASAIAAMYPGSELRPQPEPALRGWWLGGHWPFEGHTQSPRPVMAHYAVSRESIDGAHGVTVTVLTADGERIARRIDRELALNGTDDLPGDPGFPTLVRWRGSLYAPAAGVYRIVVQSNVRVQVWIGGTEVASSTRTSGRWQLAEGLHRLRVDATVSAPKPLMRVEWKPPGGKLEPIPASRLYAVRAHGLLAEYEIGGRVLHRIEPHPHYAFFPRTLPRRFTAQWRGTLEVPSPGGYRLQPVINGPWTIRVDGRSVGPEDPITAGPHAFEMHVEAPRRLRMQIHWHSPAGDLALIPPQAWTPSREAVLTAPSSMHGEESSP